MLYRFDGKEPVIGKETYVSEQAIIIGDVKIGNNCYVGHGAILRGDYGTIIIGNRTSIEEGVVIHAPPDDACHIGSNVIIGHGAIIHAKNISDSVLIGMGAVISLGVEIESGVFIAEGAVVRRNYKIDKNTIVAGNPAKKIREVSDKDRQYLEYSINLYVELAKKYLKSRMEMV
ncbi:MAG TPA: gamma carbonic anhydrase family protein [Syntrophorhabdaceae bacterium]|nr:gamma carbonic anhydrase family protein [Syntrophorhabdaceae bacterium]HPP07007.1 gamma carbonic anhydrase family protein [Syntrophorhabdaceae bacterium]